MWRKKKNNIDKLIKDLEKEFSKIPNFDLTQNDPEGKRLFNLVVRKFSEIQDFKILFISYYIPKSKKAIIDTKNVLQKSKYRKLLTITDEQFNENLYETIRLGYVGLFHKIENFIKDFLSEANLLLNENKTGKESLKKYYKDKYNFNFYNYSAHQTIHKIHGICNCVKHNDSFPTKELKNKHLPYLKENERIIVPIETFKNDIDFVINEYYMIKLQQILSLATVKMITEGSVNKELDKLIQLMLKY